MSQKNINIILIFIILVLVGTLSFVYVKEEKAPLEEKNPINKNSEASIKKVKLDFYVMSQCHYGTQVEDSIAPVMKKMGDIIDLNIDYILYPQSQYAGQESTYCIEDLCSMHGIPELQGNIVQLCVGEQAPQKALDFINCQNKDAKNIPDNWEKCVEELDLNKTKIQECYQGEQGKKLLRASKERADAVNAQGSPTMYLNDKRYEGGRSPLDFQRAICQEIENQHEECANLPACGSDHDCQAEADKIGKCLSPGTNEAKCEYTEPQPIDVTVLSDKRCSEAKCSTQNVINQLKQSFKGINEIVELDYSSEEGQALYIANNLQNLPVYLFNKDVETAYFYNDLKNYLGARGEYYELAVGSTFNPTKEICDNDIDDTENGFKDCADPDCLSELICREEKKATLDLFVMSQCPYGTKAFDIMPPVLNAFKDELDFNVNFIATEVEPGKFNTLHGQPEVDENIRELCAIKNYPKDHEYMKYITCRNKNITSTEWKGCVEEAGMDLAIMKTCSEGAEGIELHSENIKLGNKLGVSASPTWLVNNKYKFSGLTSQLVQTEICNHNPDLNGCNVDLSNTASTSANIPAESCN